MTQKALDYKLDEHKRWISAKKQGLSNTDFIVEDLRGLDFRGADLKGATFYGSDLTGADFSNVNLEDGTFSGCRLGRTRFVGVDFEHVRVESCRRVGARDGIGSFNYLRLGVKSETK